MSLVRSFFKTVRVLLGPVLLGWERLSRPRGVVREPAQQQLVNMQCRSLALYQYRTCPFCMKVRQNMRRLSLDIELRDAQHDATHRAALVAGGGKAKVPCLKITDASGKSQWLYDSDAINAYLDSRFKVA
ncbi:MAG: glutathione S-transferase N-terminal domain-containing protein [Hydrogenophaga sp.]|jgi:glutaredoxin|nr:glutathione S-transferase N-terminal domain-containing protein [Hydrogenophaga sp.]